MNMTGVRIGDHVAHVELHPFREIREVAIVRETKTLWVDEGGTKWRKKDGGMFPQYVTCRYIVTREEADRLAAEREAMLAKALR